MFASSSATIASTAKSAAVLESGELAEFFKSSIDFGTLQSAEALHAETLTTKASHDRAVDDSAAEIPAADMVGLQIEALLRQVADKAAGEAIARSGGIKDVFEKIAWHDEEGILTEQHGAVFT